MALRSIPKNVGVSQKNRRCPAAMLLVMLAFLFLVSGCATVHSSPPFSDLQNTITERTGQQVIWIQDQQARDEVERTVASLLEDELSLDEAVQIALLNNRSLQVTLEEIGISQADLMQAGLLKNPEFGLSVGFPDHTPPSNVIGLSVTQDFLEVIILPLRKKIAAERLDQTKLRVGEEVLRLVSDVKTACITYQSRQQLLDRLLMVLEINQAGAELAQRQFEAGTLNELDFRNQQAMYNESRRDVAQARMQLRADREKLNRLLGLWGKSTAWEIIELLPSIPEQEIPLDTVESLAVAQRLDVETARRDVEIIERALALQRGTRWLPGGVHIGVDSEREPEGGGPRVTGPTLHLDLPIFDHGQADRARLQAQQRQAQYRLEALATNARSEARDARDWMIASRDLAAYYAKVLLPERGKILELTLEHYNFMLKGAYDLLLAKQLEMETERAYIEAWRDYWIARAELERAVGGELPKEVQP